MTVGKSVHSVLVMINILILRVPYERNFRIIWNYTVVITIWLTVRKDPYLKWQCVFSFLRRLFSTVDVVEWSRALDVRLSKWCCSVSMVWVQIPSREEQKFDSLKSNSNTVWFNFQTYIIFSINLVSLVTLRSSGTDILYGCHLLLDVCIIYFISCDCIMNSSLYKMIILQKSALKLDEKLKKKFTF